MLKSLTSVTLVLIIVSILVLSSAYSQGSTENFPSAARERHYQAVSLLRSLNTFEVTHKFQHSGYVSWDALLSDRDFTDASKRSEIAPSGTLSSAPEIAPGWNLRLNIAADGKSYDVLLEDTTDQKCGYAAITDERGIIRQGKAIDCDI